MDREFRIVQLAPLFPNLELQEESSKTSFQAAENPINQEEASALSREHLVPADHNFLVNFSRPIVTKKESAGEVAFTKPLDDNVSGQEFTEPYSETLAHGQRFTSEETLSLIDHGLPSNGVDSDTKTSKWAAHGKQLAGGESSAFCQQSTGEVSDIKIIDESVYGQQSTGEDLDIEFRDETGKVLDDAHGQMRGETLDEAHVQMHVETLVVAHCQCGRVTETTALCRHSAGIESDSLIDRSSVFKFLKVTEIVKKCQKMRR